MSTKTEDTTKKTEKAETEAKLTKVEVKKPKAQTAAIRPITLKKIDPTKKPEAKSDLERKKQELIQKINSMSSIEQLQK